MNLVEVLDSVSGLAGNQAKTCIYYCMASHRLGEFDWFPALALIGPPGTGKSRTLDVLEQLCFKPYRITCHTTTTPPSFRDDLTAAKNKTALIEEADLYPNRKQFQAYLINRVDRRRTSGLPVKEQIETPSGVKKWRQVKKQVFGATIIHDRHSLDDMAAESRIIIVRTQFKEGTFIDAPKGLTLPDFSLGQIPDYFTDRGRAFDTWKPLLMVAGGLEDSDWLLWACLQIQEATNELRNGQAYEEKLTIFARVIKAYCDSSGMGLLVKEPLALESKVTEPLQKTMPYITPQIVNKTLSRMGLTVKRHSGTNKLFTSTEELRKVAKEIGYKDEVL